MDVSMNPESTPNFVNDRAALTALRVRCPECRKLYMVQFQDIREVKPRFECVQCHTKFWLSLADSELSDEVIGNRLSLKEPARARALRAPSKNVRTDICPKCHKKTGVADGECEHCGVVLEKYRITQTFNEGVPPHSPALAEQWKRVVADYPNETLHNEFIRMCQRERNLALASAHYAAMRTLMPTDEMTEKRIREVQALGMSMLGPSENAIRLPHTFPRLWQFPLMAATLVLIVGMVLPGLRNVLAIGAGLAFLAIMLRFTFRN